MSTARCPACGAAVTVGAPWCTLCYADLRPAPPPAPEPPVAVQSSPAAPPAPEPASSTPGPAVGRGDLLEYALDAPVSTAADAARGPVSWPCQACGTAVGIEHDTCPRCSTPFLSGADPAATVDIPLVGSLKPLTATKSSRVWLMVGGTLLVSLVLTVVLTVIGLFL